MMGFLASLIETPYLAAPNTSFGRKAIELEERLRSFRFLKELKRAESTEINLFSDKLSS